MKTGDIVLYIAPGGSEPPQAVIVIDMDPDPIVEGNLFNARVMTGLGTHWVLSDNLCDIDTYEESIIEAHYID